MLLLSDVRQPSLTEFTVVYDSRQEIPDGVIDNVLTKNFCSKRSSPVVTPIYTVFILRYIKVEIALSVTPKPHGRM